MFHLIRFDLENIDYIFISGSRREQRTHSCQTDDELLESLLQKHRARGADIDWAELDPKALLDSQNRKQCCNGGKVLNQTLKTKHSSPLLQPKARIREESVSECSLSDEDMTQIKSITIMLGSTNSDCNINTADLIHLRKSSESPLSNKINITSNGISNSSV